MPFVPRTVGNGNVQPQPSTALAPAMGQPAPVRPTNGQPSGVTGQPTASQPVVSGQPSGKPSTFDNPDFTVRRTASEAALDQMAAQDQNPANAQMYTRARNILLGNEPAPLVGVAGTKPIDVATMNIVRQAAQNGGEDFNSANATQRANNIKGWMDTVTPNSQGGQLYAANGSLEHLGNLETANNDLGNSQGNYQDVNSLQGWLSNHLPIIPGAGNDVAVKRSTYSSALGPVTGEINKLYEGGAGSVADRDRLIANLDPDAPPDVRAAAIKQYTQLLGGKVDELGRKWTQAGFASPFPIFSPKAQGVMDSILGPQAGSTGGQPGSPQGGIPPAAVARLRQSPNLASDFEAKYGLPPGGARQYLGQ
jgi:hypothetical protein